MILTFTRNQDRDRFVVDLPDGNIFMACTYSVEKFFTQTVDKETVSVEFSDKEFDSAVKVCVTPENETRNTPGIVKSIGKIDCSEYLTFYGNLKEVLELKEDVFWMKVLS